MGPTKLTLTSFLRQGSGGVTVCAWVRPECAAAAKREGALMGELNIDVELGKIALRHPTWAPEIAHDIRERHLRPEWPLPFGSPDPVGPFRKVQNAETAAFLPRTDRDGKWVRALYCAADDKLWTSGDMARECSGSTFTICSASLLFQKRGEEWWVATFYPTSPPETAAATTTEATGPE
jgi:hypothetical protein